MITTRSRHDWHSWRQDSPTDYLAPGGRWTGEPGWRSVPEVDATGLAAARAQWRLARAIVDANGGVRRGLGTALVDRLGGTSSTVNSKLTGKDWLTAADLRDVDGWNGLDVEGAIAGEPLLPVEWAPRAPWAVSPVGLFPPAYQVLRDLAGWVSAQPVPLLVDAAALALGLGSAMVSAGVPASRVVPGPQMVGVPASVSIRHAATTTVVGVLDLADHGHPSRWSDAVRATHAGLATVAGWPADERLLVVRAGTAVVGQLPWSPEPGVTAGQYVPTVFERTALTRLEVAEDTPAAAGVLTFRDGDAQYILLRPVTLPDGSH